MRPFSGSLREALLATTCLVVAGMVTPANALPAGGTVVNGQATISNPTAQSTLIQQSTGKAILNWNSFSIGSNESVTFQQPSSSSVTLNRVTGSDPSAIFGSLSSNGRVFLINPNGIIFGRGSQLNIGSLIATTSDIRNSDFMAGTYNFGIASANPNAGIVNQGTIEAATGGSVVLSAAYVRNEGVIQANLGTVVIGGAKTFAVDFTGDKLLSFAVTQAVDQTPLGADGQPVDALVRNTGSVIADGGRVMMTARAARNIVDNVINTTGIVQANTASLVNGAVVFDAGDGGVSVGGTVTATSLNAGETGGTVKALGGAVTVTADARINVSGDAGGGTVLVGGNFHGTGPEQNAQTTIVEQGATITADAISTGDGGKVAIWADGFTAFNGAISARGGALGGNGGFVETSGKYQLSVGTGFVNTLAPGGGRVGDWLLDPQDIIVQVSGGSTTAITSDGFGSNPGGTDTIAPSALGGAASNVTLQATHDITFNSTVALGNTGVGLTAQAGNNVIVAAGANTTASTTSGSNTITVASATGMFVGQTVAGTGIPVGTQITAIAGNTLTLSNNATATSGSVGVTSTTLVITRGGAITFSANDPGGTQSGSGGISIGGVLQTTGTAGQNQTGGNVSLTVNGGSGSITLNNTTGGTALRTAGGAVTFSAPSVTSTSTGTNNWSEIITGANGAGTSSNGGSVAITSTSGGVTLNGAINTTPSSSGSGGNGGAVYINSAGAVSIGSGEQLVTTGSGNQLSSQTVSIVSRGFDVAAASGQTAGDGGAVSVNAAGTSLDLAFGVVSRGGQAQFTGSATNGGNGGAVALTNTGGGITVGTPATTTGSIVGIFAQGGDSYGASGGNAATVTAMPSGVTPTNISSGITLNANAISLARAQARGGDTLVASGQTGGTGANITLAATAASGAAVTLYGESDSPTLVSGTTNITMTSRGGFTGLSTFGDLSAGVINGTGGNITIGSTTGGAALNGTGYVLLGTSAGTGVNAGSTVALSVSGGVGHGGTLTINGPVNGTTTNVESLRVLTADGSASISGAVGGTPLNNLVAGGGISSEIPSGGNGGSITFGSTVTTNTQITDLRSSGSLTFNGVLSTPTVVMSNGTVTVNMNAVPSIPNGMTLSGTLNTAAFSYSHPITLSGNETINTSASNGAITLATVDDTAAGAQSLTLTAGTGAVTLNGALGGTTALGAVSVSGGSLSLGANISTKAGAVTLNPAVTLASSDTINTTNGTAAGANITFGSTIDATSAGNQGLTLNGGTGGVVTLNGTVGATTALQGFTVTAGSEALNAASITTSGTGGISLSGAATLGTNVTLNSGNAALSLGVVNDTTAGAQTLTTVSGTGTTTLGGAIGGTTALGAVSLIATGGTVNVNAPLTTKGGSVSLGGTTNNVNAAINTAAGGATGGQITSGQNVNVGANLTTSGADIGVSGGIVVSGSTVTLDTTNGGANATGGLVDLHQIDGTTSGAQSLTIKGGTSNVLLSGNVGSTTPLGALTVSGGSVRLGGNIRTNAGAVTLNPATTVATNMTIDTTASGASAAGANITFGSTVNGSTADAQNLTLSAGTGGNITVNGAVGGTNSLQQIAIKGGNAVTFQQAVTADQSSSLRDGTVGIVDERTSGSLTFNGLVTTHYLQGVFQTTGNVSSGSSVITGIGTTSGFAVGQTISGAGIPNGTTIQSIDSATQITLSQNASATSTGTTLTPTGSQTLSLNGGATIGTDMVALDKVGTLKMGGTLTFLGGFAGNFNGGGPSNVTLTAPFTWNSSALTTGHDVTFNSVNGPYSVTVNTGPSAFTLNNSISVGSITVNASAITVANNSSVTTTGAQNYGSIPITLDGTFTAPGGFTATGNITLATPTTITTGGAATAIQLGTVSAATPETLTLKYGHSPLPTFSTTGNNVTVQLVDLAPPLTAPPPGSIQPPPPLNNNSNSSNGSNGGSGGGNFDGGKGGGGGGFIAVQPPPPPPPPSPSGPVANTPPSNNAPQTVEGTDTGGSTFSAISGPGGGNQTASNTDNTNSGNTPSGNRPQNQPAGGPTPPTAGNTPAAPGNAPPPDVGDRALSVVASPPPVKSVSHPLPVPPNVTRPVVPGYLSQVQSPPVPKAGVPGIQHNYSSSGNSSLW